MGRPSGPPGWFVFLVGMAFVFGLYYVWIGFRTYVETGGLSSANATLQAQRAVTSTLERRLDLQSSLPTERPTSTPVPECQDFVVRVPSAIQRREASTASAIAGTVTEGAIVCVIEAIAGTNWYLVDSNPLTRRIDAVYMRNDVIRAVNPTPTPSNTPLPLPTITATFTPTITPTGDPVTVTQGPSDSAPLPTITPVPPSPTAVNL